MVRKDGQGYAENTRPVFLAVRGWNVLEASPIRVSRSFLKVLREDSLFLSLPGVFKDIYGPVARKPLMTASRVRPERPPRWLPSWWCRMRSLLRPGFEASRETVQPAKRAFVTYNQIHSDVTTENSTITCLS